jgi:signal-transduction protein with cAMP-binding, CBS, and nucleotidyltransferase domain
MNIMLSAKSGDVTAWRAVEEFAAEYRQALRDQAASYRSGGTEAVFSGTCAELENSIALHQELLKHLNTLIESVASATSSEHLKEITEEFYSTLYRHFEQFRSAPAFYQLSMAFLREISGAITAQATDQLGLSARHLPEIALIAVGPAGRCEYSPFCRLQILIVHGEVAGSHLDTLNLFCHALHAGFEDAGVAVDPIVTPRNPEWRGTQDEWRQRCEYGLRPQADEELIHLSRLADQYPLHPVSPFAGELKKICSAALNGNRPALTNLIARMASLSNGIGIIGSDYGQ